MRRSLSVSIVIPLSGLQFLVLRIEGMEIKEILFDRSALNLKKYPLCVSCFINSAAFNILLQFLNFFTLCIYLEILLVGFVFTRTL